MKVFGVGFPELVIMLIVLLLVIGIPVAIVIVLYNLLKNKQAPSGSNQPVALYCVNCGAKLGPGQNVCPMCHTAIPMGYKAP